MIDIVVATGNVHKFRELTQLLRVPGIRWHSLAEYPRLRLPHERGRTFDANAIKKARAIAKATGWFALADDSGIEVDALAGAPGIRSARFAGRHGGDRANNHKLLRALQGLPASRRRARYRCSLALARPGGRDRRPPRQERAAGRGAGASGARLIALSRGVWCGHIAFIPRGRRGFGYDPIFLVPRCGKTVGQLPARVKQRLSHRARAARRLLPVLRRLVRRA